MARDLLDSEGRLVKVGKRVYYSMDGSNLTEGPVSGNNQGAEVFPMG